MFIFKILDPRKETAFLKKSSSAYVYYIIIMTKLIHTCNHNSKMLPLNKIRFNYINLVCFYWRTFAKSIFPLDCEQSLFCLENRRTVSRDRGIAAYRLSIFSAKRETAGSLYSLWSDTITSPTRFIGKQFWCFPTFTTKNIHLNVVY